MRLKATFIRDMLFCYKSIKLLRLVQNELTYINIGDDPRKCGKHFDHIWCQFRLFCAAIQ